MTKQRNAHKNPLTPARASAGDHHHKHDVDLRRLLTAAQAAEVLSISTRKLWELTNCGEIPSLRIGRSVRYRPEQIQAWLDRLQGEGAHHDA